MLSRAFAVARALLAIFASQADLILENLALREPLAVLQRSTLDFVSARPSDASG